jgi:hypothetical protein
MDAVRPDGHESCERLFDLDPGTFEGTYDAFARRVHDDDLSEVEAAIRETRETDGDYHVTFRIVRDDGGGR